MTQAYVAPLTIDANRLPVLDNTIRIDLRSAIESMPASRFIGLTVAGFDVCGRSRIELAIRPELTFDGRVVQGGIVGLLADYAGVSAAAASLPTGWIATTTAFEVHNLAPAVGERLVALGEALQVGRGSAVSRADIWAVSGATAIRVCIANVTCKPFELRVR